MARATMITSEYVTPLQPAAAPSTRRIAQPTPGAEHSFLAAMVLVGLFFGVFGIWSAVAPLQSASVAPGVVSVEGNRKTVQHLEGGIVQTIRVREGDQVGAGQVLITLSDMQPRATRNQLRLTLAEQGLIKARLQAEFDEAPLTPIDPGLVPASVWQRMVADQQRILTGRRAVTANQLAIVDQKIAQADREIAGLEAQIRAETRQVALVLSELKDMRTLLRSGLVARPRVLALERRQAELEGSIQVAKAAVERNREVILEGFLKRDEVLGTNRSAVLELMRAAESQEAEVNEKLRVATDAMERLEIRAPIDGRIVGLQVHTPGGVISAGQALMDIVPVNESLIIEARVDPKDIDDVSAGQPAQLRILSFNQRLVAPIQGRVISVAGDRLNDPKTGQPYYLVRIAPDRSPSTVAVIDKLQPGMPADVAILSGQRTLLDYLMAPLTRSIARALREQ